MKKRSFLLGILSCLCIYMRAQNLVVNGDFEIYSRCPSSFSQLPYATGWSNPNAATGDFLHTCCVGVAGVPSNDFAFQNAQSGLGYAGMFVYVTGTSASYREYIQGRLSTTLTAGQVYVFEMYVSQSDKYNKVIDKLAIAFTPDSLAIGSDDIINITPQIVTHTFFNDQSGWTKFSVSYVADGTERYLTIGHFEPLSTTVAVSSGAGSPSSCYYLVDNISLTPCLITKDILGADTNFCGSGVLSHRLELNLPPPATYKWSTGDTTSFIDITTAGKYAAHMTTGACYFDDTITLLSTPTPFIYLGTDTAVCTYDRFTLHVDDSVFTRFTWSDGSTGSQLLARDSGIYWVLAKDSNGCFAADSISLSVTPSPGVNLGNDTAMCDTVPLTLDAQNPGAAYLWDDGSVSRFRVAIQSGTYRVEVTKDGCAGWDTFTVSYDRPPVFDLGNDTTVCEGLPFSLIAAVAGSSYQWQSDPRQTSPIFPVYYPGLVRLRVKKGACSVFDSVRVQMITCSTISFVPDIFTPNGDGTNDLFIPSYVNTTAVQLTIYNRWGELVFSTTDPAAGWDGKYRNAPAPEGMYIYRIECAGVDTRVERKSGNLTLLR